MSATEFPRPVVVWRDPCRPDFGVKLVYTASEGLAVLLSYVRGRAIARSAHFALQETAGALVEADVEPTIPNLHRAHSALLAFMKRVAPVPARVRASEAPCSLRDRVKILFGETASPSQIAPGTPHRRA